MNLCFITARILDMPIKLKKSKDFFVKININFPHSRNYFANVTALAAGIIAKDVFELYAKGDYIVIEGEILFFIEQTKKSNITIQIIDIHPAYLLIM